MSSGKVYLVGAGPGNPRWITLAAIDALRQAECVVHDKLIDRRVLHYAPADAERIDVGKHRSGGESCRAQSAINALLIDRARAGKRVVRVKGGDPLLFARGGEEAMALAEAGIEFEIVPGVTAALAAAATSGIPLTHREVSSAVAFVTGHDDPKKPGGMDWRALAAFPGTLVVYMGLARIREIAQTLISHQKPESTPLALVEWGGSNRQVVHATTLGAAADGPMPPLHSPVVAIIGAVATLREKLDWFTRRPLFGERVLLPRAMDQAEEGARELEQLGADVALEPVLAFAPPESWTEFDAMRSELSGFDWICFTSGPAVAFFFDRLWHLGRDGRALGGARIAAIGPATAAALANVHLRADLVPDDHRSEGLIASLAGMVAGKRVLLPRADRGREVLLEELARAGAQVTAVTVYRQLQVPKPADWTIEWLARGPSWLFVTSGNVARGFCRWLENDALEAARERVRFVSISPRTSQVLTELGCRVTVEATVHTVPGMVQALRDHLARERYAPHGGDEGTRAGGPICTS